MIESALDFIFDRPWLLIAIIVIASVALICAAHEYNEKAEEDARNECLANGGHWKKVGESVWYSRHKNTLIRHNVDEFGCVGMRGEWEE